MLPEPATAAERSELRERLAAHTYYHTIDVAPGVATVGWWDLRHALPLIPFPDVRGLRCLDIGTWDGFYAFELEKRGAEEVVALDVPDLSQLDYPPEVSADPNFAPPPPNRNEGFLLLRNLLGSAVRLEKASVYDLDPSRLGEFDLVVMGSLLLHLRDPVRALDAVRRVVRPDGAVLTIDHLDASLQLRARHTPIFRLRGEGSDFQWWIPNDAGARHLITVGGFEVEATSPYLMLRPGALVAGARRAHGLRDRLDEAVAQTLSRDRTPGAHLHRAYLARRRF